MRIHEKFYGELKKEFDPVLQDEEESTETDEEISAFQKWFYNSILAIRQADRKRRMEDGPLLSLADYEFIERQMLEFAARIGVDIDSDIQNKAGAISLVTNYISLHRYEDSELLTALANAIWQADDFRLNSVTKYGQRLIRLTLSYELNI